MPLRYSGYGDDKGYIAHICLKNRDVPNADSVPYDVMLDNSAEVRLFKSQGLVVGKWYANMPKHYDPNDYNLLLHKEYFIKRYTKENESFLAGIVQVLYMCSLLESTSLDLLTSL